MAAGLQCFSSTGAQVVSITDNLCRFIGQIDTGTVAGSVAVPEFANGRGFVYTLDSGGTGFNPIEAVTRPNVEISTSGFSWSFPSGPPTLKSLPVIYGVF